MFHVFRILIIVFLCTFFLFSYGQKKKVSVKKSNHKETTPGKSEIKYGIASFYANKFSCKKTANGETYRNEKYTAACNIFPFNTWIKVTDLKNNHAVIVRINDRLHSKNKCIVDLSEIAAQKLGFVSRGIAKIKVEVLYNYHKEDG